MPPMHATSVSLNGRALLITGASGSGKSALALQMMALGAGLIADDRTDLSLRGGAVWAACPASIAGRIEARGIGLLRADPAQPAPVAALVDLDRTEPDRLPPWRRTDVLGLDLPLILKVDCPSFPAALCRYLSHGREA